MRIYLAASSGSGRVPPRIGEIDRRLAEVVMPPESGPWQRLTWKSRDDSTWLLAWSNEPEDRRLLPPLRQDGEAVVGCPGYLGDPGDMERLLQAGDPGATADGLSGVFGVFRADQRGYEAITTAARLHPVYYTSRGDLQIAGNRALLVYAAARAAGEEEGDGISIRYDVPALHSLVRSGYFISDDTPFEGVRALPAHSSLEARAGAQRIRTRAIPIASAAAPTDSRLRALLDDFADSLIATATHLRAFSEPVVLSLTGGRDSRLVAAALHAARLPFRASTSGFPDHPDVVLAARVAELLGIEHESSAPPREESGRALIVKHPLLRAREVVRFTEGMISAHNNVTGPSQFRISPRVSGAGGEQLRGGFLANQARMRPEAMRGRVRDLFMTFEGLMTDTANERARAQLAPWAEHAEHDPMGALDRIYLYYRTGRWSAAGRASAMAGRTTFNLLFDNLLTRRALAMSPRWRWSEVPVHETIARLAPPLRDLPLAGKRWRHDARAPLWPFRRAWSARAPLVANRRGAGFDWRDLLDVHLLQLLREQVLGGPAALFEIVERRQMEALLSKPPRDKARAVFAWNAYTASVLLSGAWLAPAPVVPNITIPLPDVARR